MNPDGLEYYVDVDNLDYPWLSTDGTNTISYDLVSYDVEEGVYRSSIRIESSAINEYYLLITVEKEPNQAPIFVLDTEDFFTTTFRQYGIENTLILPETFD